jgi:hypothetical protein
LRRGFFGLFLRRRRSHFDALSAQRCIKVFEGSLSSRSFLAVSMPATGRPLGSINPICTSTLA